MFTRSLTDTDHYTMAVAGRQGPSLISRQDKDLLDRVREKAGASGPRSLAKAARISKGRATDILEGRYPSRNLTEEFRKKLLNYLASEGSATDTVARETERRPPSMEDRAAAYDLIAELVAFTSGVEVPFDPGPANEAARAIRAKILQSLLDRPG